MVRLLGLLFTLGTIATLSTTSGAEATNKDFDPSSTAGASSSIQHIVLVWFENREASQITAATAPYFTSFAAANVNFTNFYGVTHPSQPNYLDGFSGSNQGITNDGYCTFPASTDNLAKQLTTAGKSWRVYAQDFPGSCFDGTSFNGGVDGPGLPGQYVRKHNPAIGFESVRLDSTQCSYIQPLANFDPTVDFAFVVPNMTNDMHDGTTAQGDAFLQAFVPLVTSSPDWAHTLLIVTFDEGTTSTNGGGHIYTAAAAPWLAHANVTNTYNHFSVLRTIEQVYGLPYLGSAATATTITELLPSTGTPTPTATATATATPTATSIATATSTATATATATIAVSPTPSVTASPTVTPSPAVLAINLSTRMRVQTGDDIGIGGFIITGTAQKQVLIRAIGPSLAQSGLPDPLADPVLELHGPAGFTIIIDDNWQDDPTQRAAIVATGIAPTNILESAIDATLYPGAYTAIVRGKNEMTGVGLVEIYDLNPTVAAKLSNMSTRAFVSTSNDIVITGFILSGQGSADRIIVRGLGPSLTTIGIADALQDPTVELRNNNGELLLADDNWQDDPSQATELIAAGLAPTNVLEAGIATALTPGAYTALLSGLDNGTGIGLIEVYDRGQP